MTHPNLAGVITKDDVFRKGTGSYAADYISWARIANHLHTSAPGWEFHIKPAPDGGHVWQAPDGSAYLVTYFTGPEDQATPDFVYPCQDNRNQPIRFDKVSCRTLTDSHRRALCANAAFSFSLGYELWAREEVEEAKDAPVQPTVETPAPAKAKPVAAATKEQTAPELDPEELPITDKDLKTIRDLLAAEPVVKRNKIIKEFNKVFEVPDGELMTAHITLPKHLLFIQERLST
jgi:hypothetical protein